MKSRVVWGALAALAMTAVAVAPPAQASNDLYWSEQYGPHQIHAGSAWAASRGDGVIIAVVDSGVDVEHPDLAGKLVIIPGSDLSDGDDNPDDDSERKDGAGKSVKGHGTHVAGTAAAITDNGEGIAGVAPGARIMPLKVFPSGDRGLQAQLLDPTSVARAITMAVDNGARVINLSLSTFFGSTGLAGTIETPCADALRRNALCVVAAGNAGKDRSSGYPSNIDAVIVTSNGPGGKHSSFGQTGGTKWSISAPGEAIMSTIPIESGRYGRSSGTSMAAPHVAGVAALLFAQGLNAQQVAERLVATASPTPDDKFDGAGQVNAAAATGAPINPAADGAAPAPAGGGSGASPAPAAGGGGATAGGGQTPAGAPAGGEAPAPGGEEGGAPASTPQDLNKIEFGVDPVDEADDSAAGVSEEGGGGNALAALGVLGGLVVLVVGGSMLRNRFD